MADITIIQKRGFTEVIIKNEMTIYSAMEDFKQHIQPAKYKKMVKLDLSAVSEIDTAGIQILIALIKKLTCEENKFSISGVSDVVRNYISLFQLDSIFQLVEQDK